MLPVRKEYWLIIWVVPLLIFFYFIGWVVYFHLVPIFPPFCIVAALLIVRVFKFQLWRRLISPILILTIICFGLVVSILLVTLNINSYQFKAQAVVVKRLNDNDTVFIGRQVYLLDTQICFSNVIWYFSKRITSHWME